jgi:hypothetical protein
MNRHESWILKSGPIKSGLITLAAIAFILSLHGAMPFFMMPTLGQAIWTTGFSQSFAHGPWYSIHAHDFGVPKPAAMAFGLAGAWPASVLIRLGIHPADAYAGMVALWVLVAFFSSYKIAQLFGVRRSTALLGAVAWTSMPIFWGHAGYSMVALGIGLLPFYFMSALKLFCVDAKTPTLTFAAICLYLLAAVIAVFMDGYTFMMFATGASILLSYSVLIHPERRSTLLRVSLPVHVAAFALAYLLFRLYIGKAGFGSYPVDFFRGWGLDLSFIAIPTKGIHWLSDLLGISVKRNNETYFGDASVWETTFSLHVLVAGLVAWWLVRKQAKIATGALLVAAFGFYMALGPSLKIQSTKPEALQITHPRQQSALMGAEYALIPTGSAWLSVNLPGFKVMRASYRWWALAIFSLWLLIMICAAHAGARTRPIWGIVLLGVTALSLPNMSEKWQQGIDNRRMFGQIDRDLVSKLGQRIRRGETAVFLPFGNDFFANYLASRIGFRTFNIGGDKNFSEAQAYWPEEVLTLGKELDVGKTSTAVGLLLNGTADVLVVPYFHMLWSAHLWPCVDETAAALPIRLQEEFRTIPGFICPLQRKAEVRHFIEMLGASSPYIEIVDDDLFSTIRLRTQSGG